MNDFSEDRGAELRELFFESAQDLLQALNDEALKLEKPPHDPETVRGIRRSVHTLKGDAAACGFRELSELAHELEDALAAENLSNPGALAELAFNAADTFDAMLKAYRSRKKKLPSTEPVRELIQKLAAKPIVAARAGKKAVKARGGKGKAAAPAAKSATVKIAWSEYETLAVQKAVSEGMRVFQVSARIDSSCAMPIAGRQLLSTALSQIGQILASRPEPGAASNSMQMMVLLASQKTAEQVLAKSRIPTVIAHTEAHIFAAPEKPSAAQKSSAATEPGTAEPAAAASQPMQGQSSAEQEPAGHSDAEQQGMAAADNILRVDAERIDAVLNLVGELIIGKSMLQQALNELTRTHPKDGIRGRFADAMAFQSRVLNDLQRSVMKVRMVPVEQLFRRFPRLVRDVSRRCGREVQLVMSGVDTDLDKGLLDSIAEPITHLVRNAVSHGIEDPSERTAKGKPAQGTVRIEACHQGNQVVVEIGDDGRGIDTRKVKARAIELGLVSAEQTRSLTEGEILEFVFLPGFSTAEEVTEISGRGVGLDVVRSVLHRLKGTVEIETRPGQGTTFRLKLPLTLAIIKALLFRVEQRLYAIPLNAVAEIARAKELDLHQVDGCEVLQLRKQVLPLVRLGRRRVESADSGARIFVLVVKLGERNLGLIVDALDGEEELVIKALDDHTVATDLVTGASIMGDGRVVLIMNLAAIMDRFAKARPQPTGSTTSGLLLSRLERSQFGAAAAEARA